MSEPEARPARRTADNRVQAAHGGNAVYALGLIGALVYFWQQAHSAGEHVLAVLQALVWPAILVYDALRSIRG